MWIGIYKPRGTNYYTVIINQIKNYKNNLMSFGIKKMKKKKIILFGIFPIKVLIQTTTILINI